MLYLSLDIYPAGPNHVEIAHSIIHLEISEHCQVVLIADSRQTRSTGPTYYFQILGCPQCDSPRDSQAGVRPTPKDGLLLMITKSHFGSKSKIGL